MKPRLSSTIVAHPCRHAQVQEDKRTSRLGWLRTLWWLCVGAAVPYLAGWFVGVMR